MRLKLNGENIETEKETIASLLEEMKIAPERVAVEVNHKVIKRTDFSSFKLKEGDIVEIVHFVGGGLHGG